MKELLKDVQALKKPIQRSQKTMAKSARRKHQGLYPNLFPCPTVLIEYLPCPRHCPRCQRFMEVPTGGGQKVIN